MLALGCLLYTMLFPKEREIYWDHEVAAAIERQTTTEKQAAQVSYQVGIKKLGEKRKLEHSEARQKLIDICFALLHDDPAKRMTLATLQSVL